MNRFTLNHYFHPKMKGKAIKKVLPAVLQENSERISQWLENFDTDIFKQNRCVHHRSIRAATGS